MATNEGGTKENGAFQKRMESEESEKTQRVFKAVQFLQDPQVKSTPVANKVQFLMSKGLSIEELCEAFEKSGRLATSDGARKSMNGLSSFQAAPNAGGSLLYPENVTADQTYPPRQHLPSTYTPPVYVPRQQQQQQLSHEMLDAKESGWGDYIIAAAGGFLGLFAAFKAFQAYSPYEIRRKDETLNPRRRNGLEQRGWRRERLISSDADMDLGNEVQSKTVAPPLPETPSLPHSSNLSPTCIVGDANEEVKKLQADLKDTQELLEKEKRSKAELSVTLGKLRGQFLSQSRTNEKLELKLKNLQQELDKLQNVADDSNQAGKNGLDSANEIDKPECNNHIDDESAVSLPSEGDRTGLDIGEAYLNENPHLKAKETVSEE